MAWIRVDQDGSIIEVHVLPQGRKNEIIGLYNDRLKVKIDAPPVDGKANACLLRFLAEVLKVKISSLELIKGEASRQKQVKVYQLSPQEIDRLIFKRTTS
jgi:uncharacterized protein (TIGR00251 family)